MRDYIDPVAEQLRLQVLHSYKILDTAAEEGFDRITRLAARLLDVPVALVSLIDENRQWFKSCYGTDAVETSREVSFCSYALFRPEPLIIPDARLDPRFALNPHVVGDPFVRFYTGIPLFVTEGVALGTLCVVDHQTRTLSKSELQTLSDLAAMVCDELRLNKVAREAAYAAELVAQQQDELVALNTSLEEIIKARTDTLVASQKEILERLGRASAFRDHETACHVTRMSRYCEAIAEAAGLNQTFCKLILEAAPMHDLGKIGIPDEILLKSGPLSYEEMTIMRTHVQIGAELLAGGQTAVVQLAELIAWTHHERWDGSGYPRALSGEAIPLVGRIAAIADVFDALISSRPYKDAWSLDSAADEIRSQAGRHFDPDMVKAFEKALPAIFAIARQSAGADLMQAA